MLGVYRRQGIAGILEGMRPPPPGFVWAQEADSAVMLRNAVSNGFDGVSVEYLAALHSVVVQCIEYPVQYLS
jgi:hypothetical protein